MLENHQFSEGNLRRFQLIDELILMIIINVYLFYSDIWQTVSRVHNPRGQHSVKKNRLEYFLFY